jgi:shikimate kinase
VNNVYLVGMPGSGKSAVGRELAKRLGREFIDLDSEIELAAGRRIAHIFESEGEQRFRALERESLARVAEAGPAIVSCGGGVVLDPLNRRTMKESGTVVLLSVPLERLRRRVRPGGSRPLVRSEGDLERLLAEREPSYRAAADRIVQADGDARTVAAAVAEVLP